MRFVETKSEIDPNLVEKRISQKIERLMLISLISHENIVSDHQINYSFHSILLNVLAKNVHIKKSIFLNKICSILLDILVKIVHIKKIIFLNKIRSILLDILAKNVHIKNLFS